VQPQALARVPRSNCGVTFATASATTLEASGLGPEKFFHSRHSFAYDQLRMSARPRSRRVAIRPLILDISSTHLILRDGHTILRRLRLGPASAKPVVKWPGGKQWLAHAAPYLVPKNWDGRYYEPFVGGAALFFALSPDRATLADRNIELMATYRALRQNPETVIRLLRRYPYDREFYYGIRDTAPRAPATTAARLLYLNRACWNGLYRVNKEGRFNTPFGRFINPTICDPLRLTTAARLLRRARLRHGDFAKVVAEAVDGDLVYFDPPYITGHQHNGFLKYNAPLFSWADQQRLAQLANRLMDRGVHVLVSNTSHSTVRSLYKGFHCYLVRRRSLIAGAGGARGVVSEILISSYPLLNRASHLV
jgi:DNA adenine methylase